MPHPLMCIVEVDLLRSPNEVLGQPWVRELSPEKNFELASGTLLLARKPAD